MTRSLPVAVVTGAGRGVGRGIATVLAREGFAVALLARTGDEIAEVASTITSAGGVAQALVCDVTSPASVESAFDEVGSVLGAPDLLVNNAGRAHAVGRPWEVDPDDWWTDVEVNLKGAFLCSRAALQTMVARRSGCIVNVATLAAMQPYPYASAYAASKAALVRLTDSLAEAVRDAGIDVFVISPGLVRTSLLSDLADSDAGKELLPEFQLKTDADYDSPEAAGELVVVLASGRATLLSGRFVHVNDDLEEMIDRAGLIVDQDAHALRLLVP
jgi:NAD(P)-dependent dehydrogenase (short-subunit alcohol dehydrogenase family)